MTTKLKLRAVDGDDLLVVSSLLQDALLPPAEMHFDRARREFSLLVTRYCWEKEACVDRPEVPQRTLSLLTVEEVERVQVRRVPMPQPGTPPAQSTPPLAVLAVLHRDGWVMVHCAGEAAIALKIGSLSVRLADLCDPWCARSRPAHPLDQEASTQEANDIETASAAKPARTPASGGQT